MVVCNIVSIYRPLCIRIYVHIHRNIQRVIFCDVFPCFYTERSAISEHCDVVAGATPAIMAAQQGHAQVLEALVAARADVDKAGNNGDIPIL